MRHFLLVALLACRTRSPALSADECTAQCVRAAGSAAPICPKVCAATCLERCTDLTLRFGSDLPACSEICSSSCSEIEGKYGFNHELCGWIVENRPSPTYTPSNLAKP